MQIESTIVTNTTEMHKKVEDMHKELIELISAHSDATSSDSHSSVRHNAFVLSRD